MFTVGHCLSIMIRRFLLLATLLSLSVCQSPLTLIFSRSGVAGSGNIITLICRDQGIDINLRMNDSIEFFVNRTFALDRARLTISTEGTSASFKMTAELEGTFTCGIVEGTSNPVTLVGEFLLINRANST